MTGKQDILAVLEALYLRAVAELADSEDIEEVQRAKAVLLEALGSNDHSAEQRWTDFWCSYPRKAAKPKAERAFKRLSKRDQLAILDHLPKRRWPKDKQYIMIPTTFLNQRRWEDEDQETTVTVQDDIF